MEEERSASDEVSNGATTAVRENGERQEVGRAARYMRELIKNQVNSNHLARAGSITDSSVLRRKGRLKEQDALIEFIVELHKTHTTEEVFQKVEGWIDEVLELPKEKRRFSKLSRMVPAVGFFFHRLPLVKALQRVRRVFILIQETLRAAKLCRGETHSQHCPSARVE